MSRNAFDALVREENEMSDLKEHARMERRNTMSNAKHTPRGKQGRMDARLHFVAQCLNQGITANANQANAWYCENNAERMAEEEALRQFKEWVAL